MNHLSESSALLTLPFRFLQEVASSMILLSCKHTMHAQCLVGSEARSAKSRVVQGLDCSKSCDVGVSLSDSQSVDEYPPLVSSIHLSIRSASSVSARSCVGGGVGVGVCVVGVGGGVGRVGWARGGCAWSGMEGGVSHFSITQSTRALIIRVQTLVMNELLQK